MNKKLFKAALLVAVVAVAGLGAYKAQAKKNVLSDIMLANVEALTNTENNPCKDSSHCTYEKGATCWIYVISGDFNKIVMPMEDHIHLGAHS